MRHINRYFFEMVEQTRYTITTIFLFVVIFLNINDLFCQCSFSCNYSSPAGWDINGVGYTIGPSGFNFNTTQGAAYNYATHPLSCTLSNYAWSGDIDFIYTGRGAGGTGHTILAATSGPQEWLNTGSSFAYSNENAIAAYIVCPYGGPQITDSVYGRSKKGNLWNTISKGIAVNMNTTYYVRLQRISSSKGKISLFLNPARTIHAPGSPQLFPIDCDLDNLGYIEHGVLPQGWYTRTLTGKLTNLIIGDDTTTSSQKTDITVCSSSSILLNAGSAISYTWSTGSHTQTISVSNSGIYWVQTLVPGGCLETDTTRVNFSSPAPIDVIPNIFSPNNDGINDTYFIQANCIKTMDLTIYNRWGEKVFETDNILKSWDGKYNSKPVDDGIYLYIFTAIQADETAVRKTGTITLVR